MSRDAQTTDAQADVEIKADSDKAFANFAPKRTYKSSRAGKAGWKLKFLASLRKVPNISVACTAARISSPGAYDARKRDKDFAKKWEVALNHGVELLEHEAWRRAKEGVKRNVWMKDKDGTPIKVDEEREYSDTLAIFLLKAHKPEKYRDNVRAELTGANGAPLPGGNGVVIIAWPHETNNGNGHGTIEVKATKQIEDVHEKDN